MRRARWQGRASRREAAQTGAQLLANEVSPHRADLVRSALRAIAPDVARVRCGDGRDLGRDEPGAYDRVLVDAPCTGLGSLRRRPEARWRRQPQDVTVLAELQRELLASALRAVRRGGVVTYVTCSPHALETTLVVRDVRRLLEREGLRTEPLHAGDVAPAWPLSRRPDPTGRRSSSGPTSTAPTPCSAPCCAAPAD